MATSQIAEDQALAVAKQQEPALPGKEMMNPPTYLRETDDVSSTLSTDPTDEDLKTLRRVAGKIPVTAYTVAVIELCERFSWYGTTTLFSNFILQDMPTGSRTGAGMKGQSGALGLGQKTSYSVSQYNKFWAYVTPVAGAYLADAHWGRFKTIMYAIAAAMVGHILLVVSAVPDIITKPKTSFGIFLIAITIMGLGTGGFKSNISPLIAEQYTVTRKTVITLKSGERVIMDPNVTVSRIYMYFYMMINVGALVGQITMVFAEKWVGFWLAFFLPTVMFGFCPAIMVWGRKRYNRTPPTGSVLSTFFKHMGHGMRGKWSINPVRTYKNMNDEMWENSKPSRIPVGQRPEWMIYDDAWVDEVRRALQACKVFCFLPIYWLCYGQIDNNLTAQAAVMNTHGLPNELLNNLNPVTLIIFIPIFDSIVYPGLRKMGMNITPIKKMAFGFFVGGVAMIWAAVVQSWIYKHHPCGYYAQASKDCRQQTIPNLTVFWQAGPYMLIGISEIFTSITGLEYAFSKAPTNMRSVVMSVNLFMNAFSTIISYAFVDLAADPLLIWNYGVAAVLAFIAGSLFWLCFRKLDSREDELNDLKKSVFIGEDPRVETRGPEEAGTPAPTEKK